MKKKQARKTLRKKQENIKNKTKQTWSLTNAFTVEKQSQTALLKKDLYALSAAQKFSTNQEK